MTQRHAPFHSWRIFGMTLVLWAIASCDHQPLVVGIHPWIGYEPLYLAQEFGWLPERVRLRAGESVSDSLAGLQQGELDAAALTLDEVFRLRAQGINMTVIAVLDVSAGSDVLMVKPDTTSLDRLAGRRIAVEFHSVSELMLLKILEQAGLRREDVQLVDLPVDAQYRAWQSSEIDAVVTYEPTASRLEHLGAVRLFDSRQLPDLIFDVLAVRQDRITGRAASLRELVAAHFQGLKHMQSNRYDALYRIATRQGITLEEAQRALAGVSFPNEQGNRLYLQPHSRLHRAGTELQKFLASVSLLPETQQDNDWYEARFLPSDE